MHRSALLQPYRVQFTHEPDAKAYGNPDDPDGRWVYDEAAITALPLAQLAAIDDELAPQNLIGAMDGLRSQSIVGMHAASWVAIHIASPDIAGPFKEYDPRAALIYFEAIPDEERQGAADPLDSSASPDSSPAE